jgi:myo-inositol-1(or 4)-monophosphatase
MFGEAEPVTTADIAVQRILVRACRRALPAVPVIAEENPASPTGRLAEYIVIDPVDGTAAFLSGSPMYTISVCLVVNERPLHGVVDFPAFGVRVWARATRGITIGGETGQLPSYGPSSLLVSPGQVHQVRRAASRVAAMSITPVPTTSAKMVLVALARASASVRVRTPTARVAPWDYPAAALIVREAGGAVIDDCGRDLAASPVSPVNGWLACGRPELTARLSPIMTGATTSAL